MILVLACIRSEFFILISKYNSVFNSAFFLILTIYLLRADLLNFVLKFTIVN